MSIDTLPDTINTLVEAEERAQCSQVVEEENTTHTLYFSVYSVSAVLPQTAGHNMPMHSPHFERRVFNMMTVTVMSRDGKHSSVFEGHMRVSKNFKGDKWLVIKDLTDEEMELMKTDKEFVVNEYLVSDYYIILN